MFKYFIKNLEKAMPITSKEYENYMIKEAISEGETKTTAMRVIRENRQEAREESYNVFTLNCGAQLIIEKEIK